MARFECGMVVLQSPSLHRAACGCLIQCPIEEIEFRPQISEVPSVSKSSRYMFVIFDRFSFEVYFPMDSSSAINDGQVS